MPQVCKFAYTYNSMEELTGYLDATVHGHVAYAQWPNAAHAEENLISTTYSKGEDWALVEFSHAGMTYNTFHVPGTQRRQKVTGYVKNADLGSGEVWVCAGVSGVQSGFLKQHPASIVMSKSLFAVRSISLERPLGMSLLIKVAKIIFTDSIT